MPINPNIALGVQQQQPVNMLGQLGQIYALKGAKQEFEGNEALREAYAQGGDLNDPAFRQRVMAANPKLGSQLIKTSAETSKLQNEAVAKRIELSREMLTGINTPEDYLAWHESNHKDPVLGGYLSQRGVTAEDSRAKIMAELGKPGGLERLKRESALGAGRLQQELMQTERSVQVANIGAGPGYQRNALEREKMEFERANPVLSRVDGENGFYLYNPRDPNSAVPLGMRPSAPPQTPAAAAAPANGLLMTTQPTATNLNAFTGGAPNQAGPTVANAAAQTAAAAAQPTIIKPKQPFRAPVAVMQGNESILVPADKAIGMQPATAFTEKQAFGRTETVRNLGTAIANLTDVIKPGGLLEQSTGSGLGRAIDASNAFFGRATEGAKAAAALAPIADLVLKMVPRFEGPQSDKDTQSYKEAAGQLANSGLPNETRREAAKVIIKLMKERRDQFGMTDQVGGSSGAANAAPKTISRTGTLNGRKVVEYSDGTTAYAD